MGKNKAIWLVGNKGMLGSQIQKELETENLLFFATDKEIDITDIKNLDNYIKDKGDEINVIINCSAYTAVDKAETEKDKAFLINEKGVENLSIISNKIGATLIHFSTDYVFSSNYNTPIKEDCKPNPESIYGLSKLKGEEVIKELLEKYFIFRISWLYGIYGNNFVKTIVRLLKEKEEINVVNDQIGSPTYSKVLSENIVNLVKNIISNDNKKIENKIKFGIYHYSDDGILSWFNFAEKIMEFTLKFGIINEKKLINPIKTSEYQTPAKRPSYSVFDKTKIKEILGFNICKWDKNLENYFKEWKQIDFK